MAKKSVKMITSVVVLGVLTGTYFGVKTYVAEMEEKEANTDVEEIITVSEIDYDTIKTAKFMIDNTEVVFEKADDTWSYKEDSNFPVNQDEVTNTVSSITSVEAALKIEDVEDLSEYELDNPTNVLTIETEDGETTTLTIGMENTSTDQYYLMKNDEETVVYVVDSSYMNEFDKTLYDFAEGGTFPDIDTSLIKDIEVTVGENNFLLENEEDTGFWNISSTTHEKERADSSNAQSMATSVGSIEYDTFVNYNCEDDSEYGLDDPYAVVTVNYQEETTIMVEAEDTSEEENETEDTANSEGSVVTEISEDEKEDDAGENQVSDDESIDETKETGTDNGIESENESTATDGDISESEPEEIEMVEQTIVTDKKLVLYIGNEAENGSRYVKIAGESEIYTMSEANVEIFTQKQVSDFYDLSVSYLSVNQLETLTVETDSEKHDFNVSRETFENEDGEEETTTTYLLDSEEINDNTLFTTFYNKLINMVGQSRLTEEFTPETEAEISFEFIDINGEKMEVSYYEYDSSFYAAMVNSKVYLVNKMDVKEMIESYQASISINESEDLEELTEVEESKDEIEKSKDEIEEVEELEKVEE